MRTIGSSTTGGQRPIKSNLLSVSTVSPGSTCQGHSPNASPKQSPKVSPKPSPRTTAGYQQSAEPNRHASAPLRGKVRTASPMPNRKQGQVDTPSEKRAVAGDRPSPRPRVQQSTRGAKGDLSEDQLAQALSSLSVGEAEPRQHCATSRNNVIQRQLFEQEPIVSGTVRKRLSRGTSLTPYVPGSNASNERDENTVANTEDLNETQCSLPSDLKPYVQAEVPYMGPVASKISMGSRLRLIAFDFDQTLAATHLFFRLKNVQKRESSSRHNGNRPLVDILLSGVVPFEEIWGDQARLDYLEKYLKELLDLGVFMVVVTKGSGRVADVALQLAGLRNYFQAVIDPKSSMGAKLMTVQVLMNTALGVRLQPMEAALVDDEWKNLSIDISPEEIAALPPTFHSAAHKAPTCDISTDDFEKGNLVGPASVCRIMRAEQGIKSWQLRQLICAATA